MNTALLRAEVGGDGLVTLFIDTGGEPTKVAAGRREEWEICSTRRFSSSEVSKGLTERAATAAAAIPSEFARLIPDEIARVIRQWALGDISDPLLCVSSDAALASVMWELLPVALGIGGLLVARVPDRATPARIADASAATVVMVAGWSVFKAVRLPGIDRELRDLPLELDRMHVRKTVLPEAPFGEFARTYIAVNPTILHVSSFGIDNSDEDNPRIIIAGGFVGAKKLANLLAEGAKLRFLVLNTCEGGSLARILSERLGITVIGWAGYVNDDLAADFPLFFYRRLAEGATAVDAVRAFMRRMSGTSGGPVPAICLPSLEAAQAPDFALGETVREAKSLRATAVSDRGSAEVGDLDVRIDFDPLPAINPALLMNGRPPLERLSINASRKAESLRLEIVCDAGIGRSAFRRTLSLADGAQTLRTEDIRFPVLYELITQRASRRYVNFVVSVLAENAVLAEVTKAALWMGHNEWMDQAETWPYIPSFVQPNSDGVQQIFDTAGPLLKKIGRPSDDFNGYELGDRKHVQRQIRAIFQTLRDAPFSLQYFTPPSGPVYLLGTRTPAGQVVRFPDEIVKHKRATCHDLALLFAACAEHVNIFPLVILIRRHTFFGFWQDSGAHERFWRSPTDSDRSDRFGSRWMIRDLAKLQELGSSGAIELLESTLVTKGADYDSACSEGRATLANLVATKFDAAIDVCAARHIIQPL